LWSVDESEMCSEFRKYFEYLDEKGQQATWCCIALVMAESRVNHCGSIVQSYLAFATG